MTTLFHPQMSLQRSVCWHSHRKAVGVSKDNPFLFPVVHAGSDHCSRYHSVRRVGNLAGVEDGSTLTATKMRHYSSTHYAALDVPQKQHSYFYLHMGHSQQINEQNYQTKATMCRTVNRVANVVAGALNRFVKFELDAERAKGKYLAMAAFPNVIGCIDCTHVRMIGPHINEHEFVCDSCWVMPL